MPYKPQYLSEELIARLDRELGEAIAAVDDGKVTKAAVALSFAVGLDEDAKTTVEFTHKSGTAQKGSFQPSRQQRLPLDEEAEATR